MLMSMGILTSHVKFILVQFTSVPYLIVWVGQVSARALSDP